MAIKFSSDKEHVNEVLRKLKENDGYCPCRLIQTPDTKCMCKEFREDGICRCGLYIKTVGE